MWWIRDENQLESWPGIILSIRKKVKELLKEQNLTKAQSKREQISKVAYSKQLNLLVHGLAKDELLAWKKREVTEKILNKFLTEGLQLTLNKLNQGVEPNLNPNRKPEWTVSFWWTRTELEPAKFYYNEPEPNLNPQNCVQVNPNRTWTPNKSKNIFFHIGMPLALVHAL